MRANEPLAITMPASRTFPRCYDGRRSHTAESRQLRQAGAGDPRVLGANRGHPRSAALRARARQL